ncbi:PHP domain-containing protein [bacterium]|nr:PHP domain-containing protein [bacterium]
MMDLWVDLHVHTYYSDGLLSPSKMVQMAKETGLSAVGICDHDTINGLEEAETAGQCYGIEVVPGIELSSQYKGRDLHILGYYFDLENLDLIDYIERFCAERYRRAAKMVGNLNQGGVHIRMDDVEDKAQGNSIGRPHIAEVLMEKGYVETFQEAFHRYIGYGADSYVEKYKLQPVQAIQLVSKAKGISILAHPGPVISDEIIIDLVKMGIDGIEVIHPNINQKRTRYLMDLAQTYGLLISGGSDCHGGRTGQICMGKYNVPYSFLESIKVKKSRMDAA